MSVRNYSTGLRIYCADRKKMIQECKNPITEGDFKWIFACNCEVTEQLRLFFISSHLRCNSRYQQAALCNCLSQQLPVHTSM